VSEKAVTLLASIQKVHALDFKYHPTAIDGTILASVFTTEEYLCLIHYDESMNLLSWQTVEKFPLDTHFTSGTI